MSKAGRRIKELFRDIQEALEDTYTSPCSPCQSEEHIFCDNPDEAKYQCCCVEILAKAPVEKTREFAGLKNAEDITDVQSTGRKRAARDFPISEGMICEWTNLKHAGGGVLPIYGCLGNLASNIHHGPDKNTLNNNISNVHRICAFCHNYWHGQNDTYYGTRPGGTEPFIPIGDVSWSLPDMETRATLEETVTDQVRRKTK